MDLNGQPRIPLTTRLKRAALAFDAWLNASLYSAGRRMSDGYERFSERSDKLRVRGFKRAVLDLASEATTLGTGGARGDAGARPAGLPRDRARTG